MILVVDDEPNVRLVLRTALEADGYRVCEAVDGGDALAAVERQAPDLMLLDLRMPGTDGIGVLERLAAGRATAGPRPPRVVVLTAHGSVALAVKAVRLGASDFLEKPVTPDELRLSVACVLDEANTEPSGATRGCAGSARHCEEVPDHRGLLARVRQDLAEGSLEHAEELIVGAADLASAASPHDRASYYNLLGLIHEAEGRLVEARTFYRKAIAADRRYAPAQDNAWRIYDLLQIGRTPIPLALGDDAEMTALRRN
jgi:CheY-like chemotaxis protein